MPTLVIPWSTVWRFKSLFCSFPPGYVSRSALHIWVKDVLPHFCLWGPEPLCNDGTLRLCIQILQCPRPQYNPSDFSGRKGWKFYQSLTHLFSSSFKATWFSNVASPSPQTFLSGGRKNVESEGSHDWTDKATDIVCHRAETHMQFCNIAEFLLEPETCFCDFYLLL